MIVERRAEVAPDSLLVAPPTMGRIGVAAVFTVSFTYKVKYIYILKTTFQYWLGSLALEFATYMKEKNTYRITADNHKQILLIQVFANNYQWMKQVFRIRIRIHRIHMFLGLPDPDPFVRSMDPDPSIIKQKSKKNL